MPRQEEPEEDHKVSESGESVLIPNYDKPPAQQETSTSRIYMLDYVSTMLDSLVSFCCFGQGERKQKNKYSI
jgi:hypothetical protein